MAGAGGTVAALTAPAAVQLAGVLCQTKPSQPGKSPPARTAGFNLGSADPGGTPHRGPGLAEDRTEQNPPVSALRRREDPSMAPSPARTRRAMGDGPARGRGLEQGCLSPLPSAQPGYNAPTPKKTPELLSIAP